MKVAIVFDDAALAISAAADVRGALEAVDAVADTLHGLGHEAVRIGADTTLGAWTSALSAARPAVVFNLCEGLAGRAEHEAHVAAVIELLGIPATGCTADTLALARRKDRVNPLLESRGLPVAEWQTVTSGGPLPDWEHFPAIVKPAGEDASVGITQSSIVRDAHELDVAIEAASVHGPIVVQRYLGGRELNVGIVGRTTLPVSEIVFERMPAGSWPIVSYDAKWSTGSAEDRGTRPRCPALLADAEHARALALALAAWRAIEGRGYGRVDLRADDAGELYVLEVNPNPDLAPSAGLARMAHAHGWSYPRLVAAILEAALS